MTSHRPLGYWAAVGNSFLKETGSCPLRVVTGGHGNPQSHLALLLMRRAGVRVGGSWPLLSLVLGQVTVLLLRYGFVLRCLLAFPASLLRPSCMSSHVKLPSALHLQPWVAAYDVFYCVSGLFFLPFSTAFCFSQGISERHWNSSSHCAHPLCWPHTSSQVVTLSLLCQNQSSGVCRSEAGADSRTPTSLALRESNPTMPAALACV